MILKFNRYEDFGRIKSLGMVMPFTNTDRMNFGCPRLWSYNNIQNYVVNEKSEALSYGVIWHGLLEKILLEVKDKDQMVPKDRLNEILDNELGLIIQDFYLKEGNAEAYEQQIQFGTVQEIEDRIRNAVTGWWMSWKDFLKRFKVLEVELPVCAPVISPDGEIAKFPTYIVDVGEYSRPARVGELPMSKLVPMSWVKLGKIDVLVEERCSGDLWICDHKTSASPSSYENNIPFDVQLPSYASLLDYEINFGSLTHLKDKKISGVIYDISHSKIKGVPDLLKSGKLSKAKNAGTPSWIYQEAIEKYELPLSQYKDHLEYLKLNADPKKNFQRYYYLTEEDIDRCTDEDYGITSAMSSKRRSLVEISEDSFVDFNSIAYRYPACQKYGNCTFSTFCLANNQPSVIDLDREDTIRWLTSESSETKTQLPF